MAFQVGDLVVRVKSTCPDTRHSRPAARIPIGTVLRVAGYGIGTCVSGRGILFETVQSTLKHGQQVGFCQGCYRKAQTDEFKACTKDFLKLLQGQEA